MGKRSRKRTRHVVDSRRPSSAARPRTAHRPRAERDAARATPRQGRAPAGRRPAAQAGLVHRAPPQGRAADDRRAPAGAVGHVPAGRADGVRRAGHADRRRAVRRGDAQRLVFAALAVGRWPARAVDPRALRGYRSHSTCWPAWSLRAMVVAVVAGKITCSCRGRDLLASLRLFREAFKRVLAASGSGRFARAQPIQDGARPCCDVRRRVACGSACRCLALHRLDRNGDRLGRRGDRPDAARRGRHDLLACRARPGQRDYEHLREARGLQNFGQAPLEAVLVVSASPRSCARSGSSSRRRACRSGRLSEQGPAIGGSASRGCTTSRCSSPTSSGRRRSTATCSAWSWSSARATPTTRTPST